MVLEYCTTCRTLYILPMEYDVVHMLNIHTKRLPIFPRYGILSFGHSAIGKSPRRPRGRVVPLKVVRPRLGLAEPGLTVHTTLGALTGRSTSGPRNRTTSIGRWRRKRDEEHENPQASCQGKVDRAQVVCSSLSPLSPPPQNREEMPAELYVCSTM